LQFPAERFDFRVVIDGLESERFVVDALTPLRGAGGGCFVEPPGTVGDLCAVGLICDAGQCQDATGAAPVIEGAPSFVVDLQRPCSDGRTSITTTLGGVASYGVDYVRLYDPTSENIPGYFAFNETTFIDGTFTVPVSLCIPPALSGSIGFEVVDLGGRASPRVEVALP
jgi:hypothetical protein